MTSECPSDCVRVCAHHCGVWKQQSGGSTHSRCQPCENRKCPRDYIEPGENTSLERLKATLKYLIITHRDTSRHIQRTWTKYTVPGLSPASLQEVWFPTSSITYMTNQRHKHKSAERWRSDHSIKYQWAKTKTQDRIKMQKTQPQTMYRPKHAWTSHCLVAADQHVYETILM